MAMTGGNAKLLHTGIPNYGSATNYPVKLYAYYKSTQNEETNKSTLKVGMYLVVPSSYPIGPWTDHNGSYIGSKSNTFEGSIPNMTGTRWLAENKTLTVEHDTEGKAKATIYWKWGVNSPWGQFENESGSFSVTLPTIPRASTVGATDANIGSNSSVVVSQKSTNYTHSIKYKFGQKTGYITSSGGISDSEVKMSATNISWKIPTSFYAEIPDAKTGECTLTIKTYSGSTQIGSEQTDTFTITAAKSSCVPTVTGSVVDSNSATKALTGDASVLVRYKSTAYCTISATAKNSATIVKKQINGKTITGDTSSIKNIEVSSIPFYATDSRGYATKKDVEFTLLPYVLLTNNAEASRVDPGTGKATLTIRGNFYNGAFGASENALTVRYRVDGGSYVNVTPTITTDGYKATVKISGLDYTVSHTVDVYVADLLESITKKLTIGKSIPPFYWNEDFFGFTTDIAARGLIQAGTVRVTPTEESKPVSAEVLFDRPFSGSPVVVVTARSEYPGTKLLGVTATSASKTGFTVHLTRTNIVETPIYWIAVYQPEDPV